MSALYNQEEKLEAPMNRQQVYSQLANNAFKHAAEEENAQLLAQWKILGARWLELAGQSKNTTTKDPLEDPIPWDHRQ
jgi:hypothetical protein